MIILIITGILCFVAFAVDTNAIISFYCGILLEAIAILSCTYAYLHEDNVESTMNNFKSMVPKYCNVIRDGINTIISSENVVPGDLLHVTLGSQICADARLIWLQDLKVEMSSLTGEPAAVDRKIESNVAEIQEIHAQNLVFNTAQVIEGEGYAIAYATGDNTLIGKIAELVASTNEDVKTPLQSEISNFVNRIAIAALSMSILFFIIGYFRTNVFITAFINGFIVVSVVCIPQGFPMIIVSILCIGSRRMASKDCYVKHLSSVETLGSVNLICSDKTGTLTQNKMSVENFWFDGKFVNSKDVDKFDINIFGSTFSYLEIIMAICNRCHFEDSISFNDKLVEPFNLEKLNTTITSDSRRFVIGGDASETAMFNFVSSRFSVDLLNYCFTKECEFPFNSKSKISMTVVSSVNFFNNQSKMLLIKGAPEKLVECSTHYMLNGTRLPIDANFFNTFNEAYETFGGNGERVIGVAYLQLDINNNHVTAENIPSLGYTFVGLVTLKDPPKDSVPSAIKSIKNAGVRIFMVTGDHHLTAQSIARQIGLISENSVTNLDYCKKLKLSNYDLLKNKELDSEYQAAIFTGSEIENFTDEDWYRALSHKEVVFARTSPEQKLSIVSNAQKLGNVVAVTGDGVNDSPALKKADIGIAMGITGSDV